MAEEVLLKSPPSLYKKCLQCFVSSLKYDVKTMDRVNQLHLLPPGVLKDIYAAMSQINELKDMLFEQLSDFEIFSRLLRFGPARQRLFQCLGSLMDSGKPLTKLLQNKFLMKYRLVPKVIPNLTPFEMISKPTYQVFSEDFDMDAIIFGLRLGSLFSEAGWLSESINIFTCVASRLTQLPEEHNIILLRLDCLQRLLHSEVSLCHFRTAEQTFKEIAGLLTKTPIEKIPRPLLASIYTKFSDMYFVRSEFDESQKWSVIAMATLSPDITEKVAIDVLFHAAKSCIVKRDFQRANMLICQATKRARIAFGRHHQKYADALIIYGFFLLNVDSVHQSVNAYKEALEIKRKIFGKRNYNLASIYEEISYAYYVQEYSTGHFQCAVYHVEKAVDVLKDIVPLDHLKLASVKRIKALLLEEIVLDKLDANGVDEDGLLNQSEQLHKSALQLSLDVFGEMNVQTAKHYGNLGRLYQTMNRFDEAERMHQKAIKIKSELLGPYDYEVGLSVGHLASLYTYQMKKYRDAEQLYLRSVEISLRIFGQSYSGLQYDYLGLCKVYEKLREFQKYLKYASILEQWKYLRGQSDLLNRPAYPEVCEDMSLDEIRKQYFETSGVVPKEIA